MIRVNFFNATNITADSVYQWDLNQLLYISGLEVEAAPIICFSNSKSETALPVQSEISGNDITAEIPNILLQEDRDIAAHISLSNTVLAKITIPVIGRTCPDNYIYNDNVTDFLTGLQDKLLNIDNKLDIDGDASETIVKFAQSSTRTNLESGSKLSVLFGKIKKYFADMASIAFTGDYNDLINTPVIPDGITADSELSDTSTNPIQNKAVKAAIDNISYNNLADTPIIPVYAICSTAASTIAKAATTSENFTLTAGATVHVRFTYSNSASAPTLNVNGTGAIAIKQYGTTAPQTYSWYAGSVVEFVYNGTYWIMTGKEAASTTYAGVVKLSSSTSSTSTTTAATSSAVKTAYDLANTKKRAATIVVGTSTAGYTASDVDYLCDGTTDQTEINAAITALPEGGGKIILLEGTYNISSQITVNKDNVTIEGMGGGTVLKRMFNNSASTGIIVITANHCATMNLAIDGNKTTYNSTENRGVSIYGGSYNIIQNIAIYDDYIGVYSAASAAYNKIHLIYTDNVYYGIIFYYSTRNTASNGTYLNGNYGVRCMWYAHRNTIEDNYIDNMSDAAICIDSNCQNEIVGDNIVTAGDSTQYSIYVAGTYNLIKGNQLIGMNYTDESSGSTNKYSDNVT